MLVTFSCFSDVALAYVFVVFLVLLLLLVVAGGWWLVAVCLNIYMCDLTLAYQHAFTQKYVFFHLSGSHYVHRACMCCCS